MGVALSYAVAFYALSWTLKRMEVGVVYAIWAGLGVVLVTIVGVTFLGESMDRAGVIGILLIVSGVVVLNVFSDIAVH